MPDSNVNFVKKSQILMCQFEDCWDSKKGQIVRSEIKSNINPEIGKIRPVVIIYAHKRIKLAVIIPFTTKKPAKEISNTLYIPAKVMPGVLGRTECWALCDMPQTVCTDRLRTVFSGNKNKYKRRINQADSKLSAEYFKQVREKTARLINPDNNVKPPATETVRVDFVEKIDNIPVFIDRAKMSISDWVEILCGPHLVEKFDMYDYNYNLKQIRKRVPIYDDNNRLLSNIDFLLSNTTVCMAVEVKRWLETTKDVDEHIRRMQLIKQYPPAEVKGKKLLGAIVGAAVTPEAREYAEQNGFFVLELTGENVRLLEPPKGFVPKEW